MAVTTRLTEQFTREATHHRDCGTAWRCCSFVTPLEMDAAIGEVLASLESAGFMDRDRFAVRLALEEAIMNAIRHAHQYDRGKQVKLRYHITPECLLAEVEDEGPGFDPGAVPDPRKQPYLEREGGRGLLLMRSFMTWVRYNERGTCVTMCKGRTV
jgi:serine/threonine-protein kinase RsbW